MVLIVEGLMFHVNESDPVFYAGFLSTTLGC